MLAACRSAQARSRLRFLGLPCNVSLDGIERVKVPHGRLQPSAALHDDNCAIRCKHPDMEAFAMRPVGYLLADRRRCNDPGDRSDVLAASHEMVLLICQNDLDDHDGGEAIAREGCCSV